jgi:hypothetical protein
VTDFEAQAQSKVLESEDGLLHWDFDQGYFRLNAPKAQGFVGFIQGAVYEAYNIAVYLENPNYALVVAAALDNQRLQASEQILFTVASYGRNDGQESVQTESEGTACYPSTDWGTEYTEAAFPSGAVSLSLGASALSVQVWAVDALGRRSAVPVVTSALPGEFIFEFNRASYTFESLGFPAGGSIPHTFWFRIDVERRRGT